MQVISSQEFALSAEEKELLIELLNHECTNLPVEIHHTRTATFRARLRRRQELVDAILVRLNSPEQDRQPLASAFD